MLTNEINFIHAESMKKATNIRNMIEPTDEGICDAASHVVKGELVAFPTETVYGLGANALDEKAVLSIFTAKGRPQTDPLIVHILDLAAAELLTDIDNETMKILRKLGLTFWPGPLTLIVKAHTCIPSAVTAGTGFVGLRCPAHPIAIKLLQHCKCPVAAPSANRFGHVSPTRAIHVLEDLGDHGVYVLNGDDDRSLTCHYGIESTVVKIDSITRSLSILRLGAVTYAQISDCLTQMSEQDSNWSIYIRQKNVTMTHTDASLSTAIGTKLSQTEEASGQEAPGQAITHYAPDVTTYLIEHIEYISKSAVEAINSSIDTIKSDIHINYPIVQIEKNTFVTSDVVTEIDTLSVDSETLRSTVLVDFHGKNTILQSYVLAYRDLAPDGSIESAARNVFEALRWAEAVPDAARILVIKPPVEDIEVKGDLRAGVLDRLFRASSGKTVLLKVSLFHVLDDVLIR